jgi:hypothetical protein
LAVALISIVVYSDEPQAAPAGKPVSHRDVQARPVDLALFPAEEVGKRIMVSQDRYPIGREDLPWTLEPAAESDSASTFSPIETPYWSADAPAQVDVDLGRPCYVAGVVVRPYTRPFGAYVPFSLSSDGVQLVAVPEKRRALAERDREPVQGVARVAEFRPRIAQQLRFDFTAGTVPDSSPIFVREMRVLGWDPSRPFTATPIPLTDDMRTRLRNEAVNLAEVVKGESGVRVTVSDDRRPNGNPEAPWTAADEGYWCGAAPAWIEVDLGRPCVVGNVTLESLSANRGVGSFYLKVFDEAGNELDTVPPCDWSSEGSTSPSVTFAPVRTSKVKFYFRRGSGVEAFVYLRKAAILGVAMPSP